MAKRKKVKFHRRRLILLGTFVLLLGVAVLIFMIRGLPADPKGLMSQADSALAQTPPDYREAHKFLRQAHNVTGGKNQEISFRYIEKTLEWLRSDLTLGGVERDEIRKGADGALVNLLFKFPKFHKARKLRVERLWEILRRLALGEQFMIMAAEFFSQADQLLLDEPDAKLYFQKGVLAGRIARFSDPSYENQALESYSKATKLKPEELEYWKTHIYFLSGLKRFTEAEELWKQATLANPGVAVFYVEHANWLESLIASGLSDSPDLEKKLEEAISNAVKAQPDSAEGYLGMAKHLKKKGDYPQAQAALEQARKKDPTDYRIYVEQNLLAILEKDPPRGIQAVKNGLATIKKLQKQTGTRDFRFPPKVSRARLNRILASSLLAARAQTKDEALQKTYLQDAKKAYDVLCELSPIDPYKFRIAGQIQMVEKNWPEARKSLETTLKKLASMGVDLPTARLLIEVYQFLGMPGKAEVLIGQALTNPSQPLQDDLRAEFLAQRAKFRLGAGDFAAARTAATQALGFQGDHPLAQHVFQALGYESGRLTPKSEAALPTLYRNMVLRRGGKLVKDGAYPQAIKLLNRILWRRTPTARSLDVSVLQTLLRFHEQGNQNTEATKLLDRTLADPDCTQEQRTTLLRWKQVRSAKDPDQRYQINKEAIIQEFRKLAQKGDAGENLKFREALELRKLALRFGKKDEAAKALAQARSIDPDHMQVLLIDFDAALGRKEPDFAGAEAVLKKIPEGANVQVLKARLYEAQGKLEAAGGALRDILKDAPHRGDNRIFLGNVLLRQEKLQEAQEQFQQAHDEDPNRIIAVIGMAQIAEKQGKWTQLDDYIRQAYHSPSGRNHPYVREKYLSRQADNREPAQAISERKAIFQKNPNDLTNARRLAQLYWRMGNNSEAEKMFQHILTRQTTARGKIQAGSVLGQFLVSTNQTTRADEIFRGLIKSYGSDPSSRALIYTNWGEVLFAKSPLEAREYLLTALKSSSTEEIAPLLVLSNLYAQAATVTDQKARVGGGGDAEASVSPLGDESATLWEQAIDYLDRAVARQRDNQPLRLRSIRRRIEAGKIQEAETALLSLLKNAPDDIPIRFDLARLYVRKGDSSKALELLNESIQNNPQHAGLLALRSDAHRSAGEETLALQDIKEAVKLSGNLSYRLRLASFQIDRGQMEEARGILQALISEEPMYQAGWVNLLSLYLREGNWEELKRMGDQAEKKFPANARFPEFRYQMCLRKKDIPGQFSAITEVKRRAGDDLRITCLWLNLLGKSQGREALQREAKPFLNRPEYRPSVLAIVASVQPESAAADGFAQALVEAKTGADVFFILSWAFQTLGPEGMIRHSQMLSQSRPKDWRIPFQVGHAYLAQEKKDFSQAEATFLRARKLLSRPQEGWAIMHGLGRVYEGLLQTSSTTNRGAVLKKLESAYLDMLKLRPRDPSTLNNLAYLYADKMSKPKEAMEYILQALAVRPGNPSLQDTKAWVLAKMGKFEESMVLLERVQEVLKKTHRLDVSGEVLYHMGFVSEKMSDKTKALGYYRQAEAALSSEDPLFSEVKQSIRRLRGTN